MKLIVLLLQIFFALQQTTAQLPKVPTGTIVRHTQFASAYVPPRNVDVWLPPNYNPATKYAVLYMSDGQMLYDTATTWNHQAWNMAEAVMEVQAAYPIKNVIIVGVWNGGSDRHREYFPQAVYELLTKAEQDTITKQLISKGRTTTAFKPNSNNYLKFMVTELKPFIDKTYSTLPNAANTYIMGSSMGGLIAMYAICQYPKVFGGAACISTHWPGIFQTTHNPIPNAMLLYLQRHLPNPKNHKLYFDCGDQTLDSLYPPIQHRVDAVMQATAFTHNNWLTNYVVGANHSEKAWASRVHIPLLFLLKLK